MKRLKKDKVKRGRIILSAILTMLTALISLGFGAYLGYVTLTVNYLTIGTMTPTVGGLLVVAGFFIFFGCLGGVLAVKEIFISSRNEEKFSAYKGALYSAMVYYVIIAIICIIGIIVALISFIPSNFTWSICGLALVSLLLCAGAFYLVLKEIKEHKKRMKGLKETPKDDSQNDSPFANQNLSREDIKDFSNAKLVGGDLRYGQERDNGDRAEQDRGYQSKEEFYRRYLSTLTEKENAEVDFVKLAEQLMQLEELRKAGLINDQEYQVLKKKCIKP